jgi:hypothetical protein
MKAPVVIAVIAAVVAATAPAWGASPRITVQTSISPRSIYFADVITARVDVFVDRRQVDPASIEVVTPLGPWRQLQPMHSATVNGSSVVHRTWWLTIACFAERCVPRVKSVQAFALPKLTVTARTTDGATLRLRQDWPTVNIATRFVPPDVNALVNLRTRTLVPAATFRLGSTWLATLLTIGGVLLIAFGLVYGVIEILRRRPSRGHVLDRRSPLVRTLELVRKARSGEVEERRRAVGLLARVLPEDGDGLASTASEVAWSTPDPSPDELEELARKVEAQYEESR